MTSAAACATDLTFIGSTAVREALDELIPLFEKVSGRRVDVTLYPASIVVARIKESAQVDLVMTSPANIDILVREGKLVSGSRVDFVHSRIGLAVQAGALAPDIGTPETLKAALLAAKSVGIGQGPSGMHFMDAMRRLGIADEIKAKAVVPEMSVRVGTLVARGEAEIGMQQIGELLPIAGIDYIGPLPKELQAVIVYGMARPVNARDWPAAEALVKFLTAPDKAPLLKKIGLDPA